MGECDRDQHRLLLAGRARGGGLAGARHHDLQFVAMWPGERAARRPVARARAGEGAAQVWMTGTERAPFAAIEKEAAIWRVSGGSVEPL
jgi:methyl coenzyme M reductase subunit C